jgi:hypothetical protein
MTATIELTGEVVRWEHKSLRGGDRQEGGRVGGPDLVSVPGAGHGQCRSTLPRTR